MYVNTYHLINAYLIGTNYKPDSENLYEKSDIDVILKIFK